MCVWLRVRCGWDLGNSILWQFFFSRACLFVRLFTCCSWVCVLTSPENSTNSHSPPLLSHFIHSSCMGTYWNSSHFIEMGVITTEIDFCRFVERMKNRFHAGFTMYQIDFCVQFSAPQRFFAFFFFSMAFVWFWCFRFVCRSYLPVCVCVRTHKCDMCLFIFTCSHDPFLPPFLLLSWFLLSIVNGQMNDLWILILKFITPNKSSFCSQLWLLNYIQWRISFNRTISS